MDEKVETNIKKASEILGAQYIDISWTKKKEEEYDRLRGSHFRNPTEFEEASAIVYEALEIYKTKTGKMPPSLPETTEESAEAEVGGARAAAEEMMGAKMLKKLEADASWQAQARAAAAGAEAARVAAARRAASLAAARRAASLAPERREMLEAAVSWPAEARAVAARAVAANVAAAKAVAARVVATVAARAAARAAKARNAEAEREAIAAEARRRRKRAMEAREAEERRAADAAAIPRADAEARGPRPPERSRDRTPPLSPPLTPQRGPQTDRLEHQTPNSRGTSRIDFGYGSAADATHDIILGDFPGIIPEWVTNVNPINNFAEPLSVGPRPAKNAINIENVPTFNRCLRGPGGAIYILRYIQFLDMVHDMCHARGEESNAWVKKGSDGKNSKAIFTDIVDMYVKDVLWLKDQGILPYISPGLTTDEQKKEYALFFSHICIKPKGTNSAEFYNLSITFKEDGTPEYSKKSKDYVPYDKNTTLRIQYLLLIYMKIAPIPTSDILKIKGNQSCSDFLFTNADYILTQKNATTDTWAEALWYKKFPRYYIRDPKIILHVDAESNKTGLCNIIPKICDYAFSEKKTVEYTKYFSSKEYDAALVQSSEKYINLLSLSRPERVNTKDSKTTPIYDLELKYRNTVLMSLTYTRYKNKRFYIQILRIVNYKNINEIYLDWNNKKIDRNSLLYFNYIYTFVFPKKSISKKELVEETIKKLGISLIKIKRDDIINIAKQGTFVDQFIDYYNLVLKETRDIIKLTINNAYSLDDQDFVMNGAKIDKMDAYNPFNDPAANKLSDNENLSITSSVRAITHGEHYNNNFMLNKSNLIIKRQDRYINRIWLKHLGDFGQALEFYAYTKDKFDSYTIPIFLSFDKISVYLSSLFNPMTALDDLNSDSYTKIQFYAMHRAVNSDVTGRVQTDIFKMSSTNDDDDQGFFGKVNKRYIKQKNISKRLKFMSDSDIKNKLKSVGIKITKTLRGKRKYLSRKELENKAKLFNKIQNTARRMEIKIMYKKNRIYKYKTYKRLQKEIKKIKNKPRNKKMYNSRVKHSSFG